MLEKKEQSGWQKVAGPAIASLPVVGGIYSRFFGGEDAQQIQQEVLDEQLSLNRMRKRQARGQFTDAERQDIMEANEPVVNRVADNVAARGLDESGAGAQIVGDAQRQPFVEAQRRADALLSTSNMTAFNMAKELAADDSFWEDLTGLAENLEFLRQKNGDDGSSSTGDKNVDGSLDQIYRLLDIIGKVAQVASTAASQGEGEGPAQGLIGSDPEDMFDDPSIYEE